MLPGFDAYLAGQNAVTARAGEHLSRDPIPFSRHIEQTNREDRFDRWRVDRSTQPSAARPVRLAHDAPAAIAPGNSSPRLSSVAPLPPVESGRPAQASRPYATQVTLPRGLTLDVLA